MKKLLLLVILILTTGCSVEYNVYITEDEAKETIVINEEKFYTFPVPSYFDEEGASEEEEYIEGVSYYDINFKEQYTTFDYSFPLNDLNRSRAINYCFKTVSISKINKETIINTTNHFSCMDLYPALESININITLDEVYSVTRSNADKINDNTYTWKITRNNYTNKNIQLIYKMKETENDISTNDDNEKDDEKNNIIDYILVGGVVLIFIICIIGLIKYKSINKEG